MKAYLMTGVTVVCLCGDKGKSGRKLNLLTSENVIEEAMMYQMVTCSMIKHKDH